jgi:hypothetical protein
LSKEFASRRNQHGRAEMRVPSAPRRAMNSLDALTDRCLSKIAHFSCHNRTDRLPRGLGAPFIIGLCCRLRLERGPRGMEIGLRLQERGGPIVGAHAEARRPITVIDQNQRFSGRLASQNLEWRYSECESRGTVPEQLYFAGADRD